MAGLLRKYCTTAMFRVSNWLTESVRGSKKVLLMTANNGCGNRETFFQVTLKGGRIHSEGYLLFAR
jgi:hypothetical protein